MKWANVERACMGLLDAQARTRVLLQAAQDSDALPSELFEVSEQIDKWSVFIADRRVRDEIEDLAGVIWWADKIAEADTGCTVVEVAWGAANHVGYVAGALLRREPAPPAPATVVRWRAISESLEKLPARSH